MRCLKCKIEKLRREFPQVPLAETCDHANLHCLKCVIEVAEKKNKCSYSENKCSSPVTGPVLEDLKSRLKALLYTYESLTPELADASQECSGGVLSIALLNGDKMSIPFDPSMKIVDVCSRIKKIYNYDIKKQKLIYGEKELMLEKEDGSDTTLSDFGVKPNSTIHLIVLLFAIPEKMNEVTLDLYWGYPSRGRDYLDASVLVYQGKSEAGIVDYRHTSFPGITHSGDIMDDNAAQGHHVINVCLNKLPADTTSLFFTLSAWSSPTIGKFKHPSFSFFETSKPKLQLCEDKMKTAMDAQAIIMCVIVKKLICNTWTVITLGTQSGGNAKCYDRLHNTIKDKLLSYL
nr:uncharacterized protein LOC116951905 isoform X2 [Petromyzon marinus]